MAHALIGDRAGSAFGYYPDVPSGETVRRHATKTGTFTCGEAGMRRWYRCLDLLPGGIERVIAADSVLENTVIAQTAALPCVRVWVTGGRVR